MSRKCTEEHCIFFNPSRGSGCIDHADVEECVMLRNQAEFLARAFPSTKNAPPMPDVKPLKVAPLCHSCAAVNCDERGQHTDLYVCADYSQGERRLDNSGPTAKPSDRQVAGDHYKLPIQPAEFCQRNKLTWCESNVVKYVVRHRNKKGAEDIRKAIHYLELLLEWEYPDAR